MPACSKDSLTNQSAATLKCHAADAVLDTLPYHSIQTLGRSIIVLSVDVEGYIGSHN